MLSMNHELFYEAIPPYQKALSDSGYKYILHYDEKLKGCSSKIKNKNRKRKVIWFNPPFCRSVKTDIGRDFLQIITNSFPKTHKLHKILNRNTLKLNYSCLPSIGRKILSNTNAKISKELPQNNKPKQDQDVKHRKGALCPVKGGNCNTENNIYLAQVILLKITPMKLN